MPGRKSNRTKHRTPCAVTLDGRRHNGFLIDYSLSGLFIQTSAQPEVGQRLDLELTLRGQDLPMHVEVARRKTVPAQLRTVAGGGIGVRILSAPESFYRLLVEQEARPREEERIATRAPKPRASEPAASGPVVPAAEASRFRVRAGKAQGNRSRLLEVGAVNESEAAELALEELGDGWKVLEVSRLPR